MMKQTNKKVHPHSLKISKITSR